MNAPAIVFALLATYAIYRAVLEYRSQKRTEAKHAHRHPTQYNDKKDNYR